MDERLELNSRYILRIRKRENRYILIDTFLNKVHTITYPLFFILNQFKCTPTTLTELRTSFLKKNLNKRFEEFIEIIKEKKIPELLIKSEYNRKEEVKTANFYKNKSDISPFTEYSPERIDFLITKYCNLNCKHCFEESSNTLPKSMPYNLDLINSLFSQMDHMNVEMLKITGGEPFTIPNFDKILELSLKYRFQLMILTNGILLNDKLIDLLKQKNAIIGLSLDGIDKKTHEKLRGKGSYLPLLKNVIKLKDTGVSFSFTTTVFDSNKDQLKEITDKALNEYGADNISFNYLKPLGRANENPILQITPDDEGKVFEDIQYLIDAYNLLDTYRGRVILNDDSLLFEDERSVRKDITCAAGNRIMAIDPEFNIYPCIYAVGIKDFCIGSLKNRTLEELWFSEKLDVFRGVVKLENLPECNKCSVNSKCKLKNCRLKPIYQGYSFYDPVSYCYKKKNLNACLH